MANNTSTVSQKVDNEIIRLKYLKATKVVVKIDDVVDFLLSIKADLNQPVDPEPTEPEEE